MIEMEYIRKYVDDRYDGETMGFTDLGTLVEEARKEFAMREMILKLDRVKRNRFKTISNTEVDSYYDRRLKKYDTE